jgi:septum formation protein
VDLPSWDLPAGLDEVVLASGSRSRAALLATSGLTVGVDPADLDERAFDDLLRTAGPAALALELARRKADVVASRRPGAVVVAGDQVGILRTPAGVRQLTKQPDREAAVEQLMAMSGTTHELLSGLAVRRRADRRSAVGVERAVVTMRRFDREEATAYVERFEPLESAGSYRLEDQDRMAPLAPFVTGITGADASAVLGLPIPLLCRLLAAALHGAHDGRGSR